MWADPRRWPALAAVALVVAAITMPAAPAAAQCRPASERTGVVGYWIIARGLLGRLTAPAVFWHLHTLASRAEAEKGSRGTVIEALGSVWLSTIAESGWRPQRGIRVAEIGPLEVEPGGSYTAQYMEGIFDPGMTTEAHPHPGPEAAYTMAGAWPSPHPDRHRHHAAALDRAGRARERPPVAAPRVGLGLQGPVQGVSGLCV